MTILQQVLYPEGKKIAVPKSLLEKYPSIDVDPHIHSGLPHIKGSRILVTDIFRVQVNGYTLSRIMKDFKTMGSMVTSKQLDDATAFTLEWLNSLHEKRSSKVTK